MELAVGSARPLHPACLAHNIAEGVESLSWIPTPKMSWINLKGYIGLKLVSLGKLLGTGFVLGLYFYNNVHCLSSYFHSLLTA